MKSKINLILSSITFSTALFGLENHSGQTYMTTHPIFNDFIIQQSIWNQDGYNSKKIKSSFQAYVAFSKSLDCAESSSYFLFDNKNKLTVRGGNGTANDYILTPDGYVSKPIHLDNFFSKNLNRDILGQWLDYKTVADLTFKIAPKQTETAMIFECEQALKPFLDYSIFNLWYISASIPIVKTTNNIQITGDDAAIAAMNNKNFLYAKFSQNDLCFSRVPNVKISLNSKYLNQDDKIAITRFGLTIPISRKNSSEYLFEPLTPFDNHYGITSSASFQLPLFDKNVIKKTHLSLFLEAESTFFFAADEKRSFDLENKPFSRYMKLIDIKTNKLIPAMNILTVQSEIKPFNMLNLATGLKFRYETTTLEIGYAIWGHGIEDVTPKPTDIYSNKNGSTDIWEEDRYGIPFINEDGNLAEIKINNNTLTCTNLTQGNIAQTSSKSTINYVATPDGEVNCCAAQLTFNQKNKYIKLSDFDTYSAAARATLTHKIHGSIGLKKETEKSDFLANFGGFIEMPQNNCSIPKWGCWIKAGASF